MRTDCDFLPPRSIPCYLDKAETLVSYLKSLGFEELRSLLACNNDIAQLNYERYQHMDLKSHGNAQPAILSYDGIQYKYMAPQVFEDQYYTYIEEHLRILSGLYGIVRPFDGIVPYRLEMQAQLKTPFCSSLYEYWGTSIYDSLTENNTVILNLASDEYARTVKKYLRKDVTFITCLFGELDYGKVREKGVYVKMARGEMVRYMAENAITDLEHIKSFNRLGFSYRENLSDERTYIFIR